MAHRNGPCFYSTSQISFPDTIIWMRKKKSRKKKPESIVFERNQNNPLVRKEKHSIYAQTRIYIERHSIFKAAAQHRELNKEGAVCAIREHVFCNKR